MNTAVHRGTALITGASSGIGAVYADRLARRGYDLILVGRDAERLHALATALTDETRRGVEILAADLGLRTDLARVEAVLRNDASITLLLNNAGIGATAPLLQSDMAEVDAIIAFNVSVPTRLCCAVAPAYVARGTGTIINMASIAATAPQLHNGVDSGSQAFVLAFSQSLHHELAGTGIRVQAVLPGDGIRISAQQIVDAALAGLDRGESVTLPPHPFPERFDSGGNEAERL
jgi:uncharacterized protein